MRNQNASPDQLEREIVQTRAEIDRKLTLLQQRLSARNVASHVASSVGDQGGAFARNLGATLRDNPVPALLLGIGLCWLMLAGRQNGYAGAEIEDFDDDTVAFPPDEPASLAPRTAAAMAAVEGDAGRVVQRESDRAHSDAAALGITAGRR